LSFLQRKENFLSEENGVSLSIYFVQQNFFLDKGGFEFWIFDGVLYLGKTCQESGGLPQSHSLLIYLKSDFSTPKKIPTPFNDLG